MKNKQQNPVVILGGNINGLGIVRSFQKTSIPVFVLIHDKDFIRFSRFCKAFMCPDPQNEEFIPFLKSFCRSLPAKPIVFATSDVFLMPLIHSKKDLENEALIPTCEQELFDKLIEKKYLYSFAEQVGVDCPKTKCIQANQLNLKIEEDMRYPLIVKPSVNIIFRKVFGQKALLVNNKEELWSLIKKLDETKYDDSLIVQEYIPGDMTTLYTITSYVDKRHEVRGYSIGHKIRQYPAKTGTITSGLVEHVEDILEMSKRFVKEVEFYGISNIEYKYDERDGKYKLMEINPRTGIWNLSVLESGINLPLMAYNDILGRAIQDEYNKEGRLIWAYTIFDLLTSVNARSNQRDGATSISYKQWRSSLKGCRKVDAIFKWYDPMPSVINSINLLFYTFKKVVGKA